MFRMTHSNMTSFFRLRGESPLVKVEGTHMGCYAMTVHKWVLHETLRDFFFSLNVFS